MGKNKLQKFSDMDTYPHVFQYPYRILQEQPFPLRGAWNEKFFKRDAPIVLELGCGKGEYTVAQARQNPDKNYIGVEIKGARMWSGAKASFEEQLPNVAFLRTRIECIDSFFAPGEVAEIWITFPDPQMQKPRKRLTSSLFLERYRRIMQPGGIIHLKTDSPFLFGYTDALVQANHITPLYRTDNLYESELKDDPVLSIHTFYEEQWLERGFSIKYLSFRLPEGDTILVEPQVEIPFDPYRSYNRSKRSGRDAGC